MRLIRVGAPGSERPAILGPSGERIDVSSVTRDFDADFFGGGGIARLRALQDAGALHELPLLDASARLGAPIARPGNLVCVGLNYADHARESNMAIPEEPVLFNKAPNCVVGPEDDVRIPRGSVKVDWEVELGIVIGETCRYLDSPEQALGMIAGFVACNDVSERSFQADRGGQWVKGKACETFNPCGPWLATPDEIDLVAGLDLWLDVNGVRRQTGHTSSLIFSVDFLIHYISQFMVLDPGDLVNTGTPPGVAMGMAEPAWLQAGDVVTMGVTGLGEQRTRFVPAP